eukprot:5104124-Prymnesium_polylepis.1
MPRSSLIIPLYTHLKVFRIFCYGEVVLIMLKLDDPEHPGDGPFSARRSRWSSRARSTASGVD